MPRIYPTLASLILLATAPATFAINLDQAYQLAEKNDATYQSAQQTLYANRANLPIDFGALLPQASIAGNYTYTKGITPSSRSKAIGYTLTLNQSIFDLTKWETFSQAQSQYKYDALTFATAQQALISGVSTAYFAILNAHDSLRYAQANETSLKQKLNQSTEKYNVGLVAITDKLSTQAQYESAIATTIADKNALHNALKSLQVLTNTPITSIAPLKKDLPLLKPNPANPDQWVSTALKQNVALQQAKAQLKVDKKGIAIQQAGYWPTLDAQGTINSTTTTKLSDTPTSESTTKTATGTLTLNQSIYSGGITYYGIKKAKYTHNADQYTLENTQRSTEANMRSAYLAVLSDISQVNAYAQAVKSSQSSLDATDAGYNAGTQTIVDLLNAQSTLFSTQQQYANATYTYVNDSIALKQESGSLSSKDLIGINQWLNNKDSLDMRPYLDANTIFQPSKPNTTKAKAQQPSTKTQPKSQ